MVRAQVYDLAEEYTVRGSERAVQGVRVYAVDKSGGTWSVLVTDIPHEIYIDPEGARETPLQMLAQLDKELLGRQERCRRTDCPNCPPQDTRWGVSYEACAKDRVTDLCAASDVDAVMRRSFDVYEPHAREFWRFRLTRSYYATPAKKFFERRDLKVYEHCPNAVDSFVRLLNFAGFEWYEWPYGKSTIRFDEIKHVAYEGNAPMRTVTLDIETIAKKYRNSESKRAAYPVGVVALNDGKTKTAYVLGPECPITRPGYVGRFFDDELEMLRAVKADMLAANEWRGYNSDAFDVPYIFRRGEVLGDERFRYAPDGRRVRFHVSVTKKNGKKKTRHQVLFPGVIMTDLCELLKRDTRFGPYDYKLETVLKEFGLGGKGGVEYHEIHDLFHGTPEQRARLVDYCCLDTDQTATLGDKKMGTRVKLVAKSRVKRVRPQDEIYRGAAFVTKRLVQEAIAGEYLMYSKRVRYENGERVKELESEAAMQVEGMAELLDEDGYAGGFVRDVVAGLYLGWRVFTLDFNSLYPSIIRTYNMCSTTLMCKPTAEELANAWTSSSGFGFYQGMEGVIPRIMREKVAARNEVRERMKTVTDPDELEQLEALQTEYKICANSLYGQTGAETSDLFKKPIADSTCTRGAELAQLACFIIDANPGMPKKWTDEQREEYTNRMEAFVRKLEPEERARMEARRADFRDRMGLKVIYGDTDSLMVFVEKSSGAEQTREWQAEVANYINEESGILGDKKILKMGCEDVCNMLLVQKKMYIKHMRAVDGATLKKPKLKFAGMSNRGRTPLVRETLRRMAEAVFVEGRECADDIYEDAIQRVAMGRVNFKELMHTSELGKDTEEYDSQAHAVAARQLAARDMPVDIGDRIEYYVCEILNAGHKKADRVVAGEIVESDGYQLDWAHYADETIRALERMAPLVRNYDKLSNLGHYHILRGAKRPAPVQEGGMVGSKRKCVAPQTGPLDKFTRIAMPATSSSAGSSSNSSSNSPLAQAGYVTAPTGVGHTSAIRKAEAAREAGGLHRFTGTPYVPTETPAVRKPPAPRMSPCVGGITKFVRRSRDRDF